ncbi:hypothetical protein DW322_00795 [Rhodococcus rhodnii]|uniref:Uncharacterized protein n=1 Tax=Rhodococcus rhodnii TaxID=38312 RepID=A0A6P2C9N2_9NOCA|nr:hypothetical protein DW322_00795 [Rhodococcus rhodnii]
MDDRYVRVKTADGWELVRESDITHTQDDAAQDALDLATDERQYRRFVRIAIVVTVVATAGFLGFVLLASGLI